MSHDGFHTDDFSGRYWEGLMGPSQRQSRPGGTDEPQIFARVKRTEQQPSRDDRDLIIDGEVASSGKPFPLGPLPMDPWHQPLEGAERVWRIPVARMNVPRDQSKPSERANHLVYQARLSVGELRNAQFNGTATSDTETLAVASVVAALTTDGRAVGDYLQSQSHTLAMLTKRLDEAGILDQVASAVPELHALIGDSQRSAGRDDFGMQF